MPDLIINPEYLALVPRPTEARKKTIEADLLKRQICLVKIQINTKGEILDGHTRYELCKQHNIPFETETLEFPNEEAERDWVISSNLKRRQLAKADISQLETALEELQSLKAQAEQNQKAGVPLSDQKKVDLTKTLAEKMGVSIDTASKFIQVQKKAPELIPKIAKKEITTNTAYKEAKKANPKPAQPKSQPTDLTNFNAISADLYLVETSELVTKPHITINISMENRKILLERLDNVLNTLTTLRNRIEATE